MSFDFRQLQAEQAPWVKHNFGDRPSWMPLMGIVEELGELQVAVMNDDRDARADAIADTIIFMADYCTAMGWDLQALWETRVPPPLDSPETARRLLVSAGKMQHHHLKLHQGIRGDRKEHEIEGQKGARWILAQLVLCFPFPDVSDLTVLDVGPRYEWNSAGQAVRVVQAVETTWAEVKKRDWKKNPRNGE